MSTIFCFLTLISAFMFEFRTLKLLSNSFLRTKPILLSALFAHCAFLFVVIAIFSPSLFTFIAFACLFPGIFYCLHVILEIHQRRFLEKKFEVFLNRIILSVKAGLSFRRAYIESLCVADERTQTFLKEILEFVTFSQQGAQIDVRHSLETNKTWLNKWHDVIVMFKKCYENQTHGIHLLESHRDFIAMKRQFRHRSGQISLQLRLQALIVSLSYAGTFSYLLFSKKIAHYGSMIAVSMVLFIIGLTLIFVMGRKTKWKL